MARLAVAAAAIVMALIVIPIAMWHLGMALVLALESAQFSAAGARAITGSIGLVVVALLALVARTMCRSRAIRAPSPSAAGDAAGQLGAFVAERIISATRSHPYGTVGTALVAGLAAGAVPELRKLATDLLRR